MSKPKKTAEEWKAEIEKNRVKERQRKRDRIWNIDKIHGRKLPEPFIQGFLNDRNIGLIEGDPGAGKTLLAIQLGMSIAAGRSEVEGLGIALYRRGPVVHFFGEGEFDIRPRVEAMQAKLNISDADLKGKYFTVGDMPLADKNELIDWIDLVIEEAGEPPVLIIIDTWANFIVGKNESDSGEMSEMGKVVKDLRDEYEGAILSLHHLNKQGGGRGSTAIEADVDSAWLFKLGADGVTVVVHDQKHRNRPYEKEWSFGITPIPGSAYLVRRAELPETAGTEDAHNKAMAAEQAIAGIIMRAEAYTPAGGLRNETLIDRWVGAENIADDAERSIRRGQIAEQVKGWKRFHKDRATRYWHGTGQTGRWYIEVGDLNIKPGDLVGAPSHPLHND